MRGYGAGIDPITSGHFPFRNKLCMFIGDYDMFPVKIEVILDFKTDPMENKEKRENAIKIFLGKPGTIKYLFSVSQKVIRHKKLLSSLANLILQTAKKCFD